MRGTIPISVEQATRGITRWDALAILLTLGILKVSKNNFTDLLFGVTEKSTYYNSYNHTK